MRKITLASVVLGAFGVFALPPSPAHAFNLTTFVSGAGNDANDCATVSTPCRNLDAALSKTFPSGAIQVLPGNYLSFVVTKSVDIIADQGGATIVDNGTQAPGGTFFYWDLRECRP
jgi:hypothetical protein